MDAAYVITVAVLAHQDIILAGDAELLRPVIARGAATCHIAHGSQGVDAGGHHDLGGQGELAVEFHHAEHVCAAHQQGAHGEASALVTVQWVVHIP